MWRAASVAVCVFAAVSSAAERLGDWVEREIRLINARLSETGDIETAATASAEVFDQLLFHARLDRPDKAAWIQAGLQARYTAQLSVLDDAAAARVIELKEREPMLVRAVAAAVRRGDDIRGVYSVLLELAEEYEKQAAGFETLTAAICVVYDRGAPFAMIEQRVQEPVGPVEIFEHLAANVERLQVDPRTLPPDLLVYVVDAPVSRGDLAWGLQTYGRRGQIGQVYHDVSYDDENFREGRDLRVNRVMEERGDAFSLALLRECGGVCRQQAFFAASVGKSVGVPTAYATAAGPSVGHAWVGYMNTGRYGATWDFSVGRWDDYEKLRGDVRCPQTQRMLGDEDIALLGDLARVRVEDRLLGVVMFDAAIRAAVLQNEGGRSADVPPLLTEEERDATDARKSVLMRRAGLETEPREMAMPARASLLETGLRACPPSDEGWLLLGLWSGEFDNEQRDFWFGVADRLVGGRYPDVMRRIVMSMVDQIEDPAVADSALMWLAGAVRQRPGLVCEVVLDRARLMIEHGYEDSAWQLLGDTAAAVAEDAPQVRDLLAEMRRIAPQNEIGLSYLIDAHGRVYQRAPEPANMAAGYAYWSTKVMVGMQYERLLSMAGRRDEAQRVRMKLDELTGTDD